MVEIVLKALENQVNLIIVVIIIVLAFIDVISEKNLKSQIVSLGVLGTFIGIFIGLQSFNPDDMKNSINGILLGLKTAFFTSIVGMGVALILTVIQKLLFNKKLNNSRQNIDILSEISEKLNFLTNLDTNSKDEKLLIEISAKLDRLDNSKNTDRIVEEIIELGKIQEETSSKDEKLLIEIVTELNKLDNTKNTAKMIIELKGLSRIQEETIYEVKQVSQNIKNFQEYSNSQMEALVSILNKNFKDINDSLTIAIDKLSKGATEEIIKALEQVIKEFNQELQSSFGENFVKLNESVINLLEWQENYKNHIEQYDNSIKGSKESLAKIASTNKNIIELYKPLADMIKILDKELKTYGHLSNDAKDMFSTIKMSVNDTEELFKKLTQTIKSSNHKQKESFFKNTEEIKKSYLDLTQNIKKENTKQVEYNKKMLEDKFKNIQKELDIVTTHFESLSTEIPKALQVSLNALNQGLASLTKKFQEDYENTHIKVIEKLDKKRVY